jgi:hypothetical protein
LLVEGRLRVDEPLEIKGVRYLRLLSRRDFRGAAANSGCAGLEQLASGS